MKKAIESTRSKSIAVLAAPTVAERISQSVVVGFFAVSALIGVWSFAAVAGGLITAGPTAMFRGFFSAVLGG